MLLKFVGSDVLHLVWDSVSSVPDSTVPRQGSALLSPGLSGHETRMLEQRIFMGLQL